MENGSDSWLVAQRENRDNLPTSSSALNAPESAAHSEAALKNIQSTLMMSGAFPPNTEGAPDRVAISEAVPRGLSGPTDQDSTRLMATLTLPPEDQIEYYGRNLQGIELHLAAILEQQHIGPSSQRSIVRHTDNQLMDILSPIVNNLHATGALMNPMVEDEIVDIQHQHYERAARLMPLMMGPTGEPVTYQFLRTSDPYLIGRVARLRERHLQMAHDLRIIQSADEMIRNLVAYRESAMRRMRVVDMDYTLIVNELANFVQSQSTVEGTGWYHNVPQ